jgi:hypothetical protein
MTSKHLIHQFKEAILEALGCKPTVRAIMRARSGKQRFPVAQWVEDLERLQFTTIEKHRKYAKIGEHVSWTPTVGMITPTRPGSSERGGTETSQANGSLHPSRGSRKIPGHKQRLSKTLMPQILSLFGVKPEESPHDEHNFPPHNDQQVGLFCPNVPEYLPCFPPCVQACGEGLGLSPALVSEGTSPPQSESPFTSGTNTPIPSGTTTPTAVTCE